MRTRTLIDAIMAAPFVSRYPHLRGFPGPDVPDSQEAHFVVTRAGGATWESDGVIEVSYWNIETIGGQANPDQSEALALDIHRFLMGDGTSRHLGGLRVESVQTLNGPQAISFDNADRTHFACDYALRVESYLSGAGLTEQEKADAGIT